MIRNVEAVYVNGGLKLVDRLPLRENERERVSIDQLDTPERPAAAGRGEVTDRFRDGVAASRRKTAGPLDGRDCSRPDS